MKVYCYNSESNTCILKYSNDVDDSCENCFCSISDTKNSVKCEKNRYFIKKIDDDKKLIYIFCLDVPGRKLANFYAKHLINIINSANELLLDKCGKCAEIKNITAHNTKNFNSSINLELEGIVSEKEFLYSKNKIDLIKSSIIDKPVYVAEIIEKIIRWAKHASISYIAMDYYSPKANIKIDDLNYFKIHGLLIASYYLYEQDFKDKNIKVNFGDGSELKVFVDYNTIKTAFVQIFDNAVKYCAENTEINISFNNSDDFLDIIFEMNSLCISDDEMDKIFLHGERGIFAEKYDYKGEGIGMGVVKKMLDLNNGKIFIERNGNACNLKNKNDHPICNNRFIVKLPNKNNIS